MGPGPPCRDTVSLADDNLVKHVANQDNTTLSSDSSDASSQRSRQRPRPLHIHHISADVTDGQPASPGWSSRGSNHYYDSPSQPTRSESSSTPPTSLMPTPEQTGPKTDPFANLSLSHSTLRDIAQAHADKHVLSSATLLTSESLRPLDIGGSSSARGSGHSVASSSEAHDRLGPLPAARPGILDRRPSLPRNPPPVSRPLAPPRIPLPSPPAMGLSELLSGTSLTPRAETCYFSGHHSEPSSLTRSVSGSRRIPHYSPFRSYYGELPEPETDRATVTPSEKMDEKSRRPETRSSPSVSRPRSDSGSSRSFSGNQGKRDPHVQNNDGVLAPHGSFTSSRPMTSQKPKALKRPGAPASDSQLYLGTSRKSASDVDDDKRLALEKAAARGDQLAMYRLGWRADTPTGQRYHLGSVDTVWGLSLPAPTATRRSSKSSSVASLAASPREAPSSRHSERDLFSDAAALALQSKAANNQSSTRQGQ